MNQTREAAEARALREPHHAFVRDMTTTEEFIGNVAAAKLKGEPTSIRLWGFIQFGRERDTLGWAITLSRDDAMKVARDRISDHLRGLCSADKQHATKLLDAMTLLQDRGEWTSKAGQTFVVQSRPLRTP